MSIGGAALGLAGYFGSEWAAYFINNETGAVEEYSPIILAIGILVIAPGIAAIIGAYAGRNASGRTAVLEAAVGSLTGTVLYGIIALSLLGQYSQFVGDAPAFSDIAAIAGLIALTSVVAGTSAVILTQTVSDRHSDESSSPVPTEPGPEYTT